MRIIEATPAPCLLCGAGNTPTNDGSRRRFLDLERDVNWNDPAIFCEDCVMKVGGIMGMLSSDALATLQTELRLKDRELHKVKADMDSMQRRAKKLGITFERGADASKKVAA